MITSSEFGSFDPLNPATVPGESVENLYADPIDINAPIEVVWKIMTDFDRYPEWNPLNRFFRLDSKAEPNHTVTFGPNWETYDQAEGEPLPDASFTQHETITVWEVNCCLAYAVISPELNAERVQHISTLPNGRTRYHTYERTSGSFSPDMRRDLGDKIIAGFRANGEALKKRAESFSSTDAN
ncbi:SRPBCC family protein [Chloroflexota bacterium]